MKTIDFPSFDYRVKKVNGQLYIFDRIRKRYLLLTPEEWVRQHLVHFLIDHRNYPAQLIAVEKEISLYGLKRRFDVVCYDREANPYLVVECKAPSVELCQETFDQVFQYNLTLGAPFVAVTNGCTHCCGEMTVPGTFKILPDFPYFGIKSV